jgi:transposase-like protein
MASQFTVSDFFKRFPDDDACLDHLMQIRYGFELDCPKCGKHGKFSRITKQPAYQCAWCGHHIHPMAGTPFTRSSTPLQKWFYAMYLFTTSRHGVPAKELQRQLGVTYKTAWRMGHEIRKYMTDTDGDDGLSGHVEADETYVGGKPRHKGSRRGGRSAHGKTVVFGMVERGGDVMTKVIANASRNTIEPIIAANIANGSNVSTDEWVAYDRLTTMGYLQGRVNHGTGEYVRGHHHTNSIEGFWSQIKRSIRGTHVHVSRKQMPKYLGEFEYRYNMRGSPEAMFSRLLLSF